MKATLLIAVVALATLASPAAAQKESSFLIYGMTSYVSPLAESNQNINGITDAVKASSEFGYSFGFEGMATPMLGLEFDYLYARHDIKHDTAGLLGETTFQPISATLNLHFPVGILDFHAGPTASYVNWGDLKLASGSKSKLDAQMGYGASAGLDVMVTQKLGIRGGLRWLNVKAQPSAGGEALDVHPLFVRLGAVGRF